MSALIDNGKNWLLPLLKFRDELQNERNISSNRMPTRRNGQDAVNEEGMNQGNYTPEYRYNLLKRLLEAQKEVQGTYSPNPPKIHLYHHHMMQQQRDFAYNLKKMLLYSLMCYVYFLQKYKKILYRVFL